MVWNLKQRRSTGLRDISGLLNADFSAFQLRVLRIGDSVTVHIVNLSYAGAGTGTLSVMLLPAGLRPPATAAGYTTRGQSSLVTSSGVVQVVNPGPSVASVTFSYLTLDPFPSTLPGVSA
ncbi:hypothetical protein GCM10009592_28800 [Brachybacterium rhamnosum]|uniref:Uncharacterized protein n=1 Tax=Brachybacterium rhamnosum TaxID=173361 RepID=A0ABW4Q3U3_9MICO